jgi:DNA-binding transcriptional ArsR family regulator
VSGPDPGGPVPSGSHPGGPDSSGPTTSGPTTSGPTTSGPATSEHPTTGIDDTVHQRHRLGILTITAEAQRADFGHLRAALGLTPGNLSRHLTVLEEAEMVQVEKGYEGRRPRTWVRITGRGRKALAAELTTLTELVRRHTANGQPGGTQPGDPQPGDPQPGDSQPGGSQAGGQPAGRTAKASPEPGP